MKNVIASIFAHRTNAVLACSATVLLAACGGTDAGSASQMAATVTTASVDSASAATVAPLSAASFNADGYAKEVEAASAVSAALAQVDADSAAADGAGETKLLATVTQAGADARRGNWTPTTPTTPAAPATPAPAAPTTPTVTPAAADTSVYHLYVATTGSDSNAGTQAKPFKTITKAAASAKASTTVHVAAGTYNGNVSTQTSGTASGKIRFVSDTKWGAKIVGTGSEAMWTNNGNYVEINGFDITGPGRLGILNYASNTLVANNHIHNLTLSAGCTGDGGAGVVNATYGSTNGDMIGNVVHDIGKPGGCNGVQGLYSSNTGGKIVNNVVYRVSSFGIHLWHAASGTTIANNTVFANGSSGMGGGIVIGVGDSPGGVLLNNVKVLNNIVYNNPRGGIQQYCYSGSSCIGTGNVVSNNLVYGSTTNVGMLKGSATGTISADPKFVSYSPTGTGDYRLQSRSPAVNKGIASGAPTTDILGVARPKGGAIDIGAYESF
jgi:parallel beta-helix repeat protein